MQAPDGITQMRISPEVNGLLWTTGTLADVAGAWPAEPGRAIRAARGWRCSCFLADLAIVDQELGRSAAMMALYRIHMPEAISLIVPSPSYLPAYRAALESGWSPDNINGAAAAAATAQRELEWISSDAPFFLASLEDREALAGSIEMPDGTARARLPSFRRWLWDGEFCGSIGFRWQKGTTELPSHVLGHIGFGVVADKRRRGYAVMAVRTLLPDARRLGLAHVDLTTDAANIASRRTIERAGGTLVGSFTKDSAYGGGEGLLYRIVL